jgi:hypothetical protein
MTEASEGTTLPARNRAHIDRALSASLHPHLLR